MYSMMKMVIIFLVLIFHKGTSDKLEVSPVNGTYVIIGSSLTFTCTTPCHTQGSVAVEFANFSKLSSTPCQENATQNPRMAFSCSGCQFNILIHEIQTQDQQIPFRCMFRGNVSEVMTSTTHVNVVERTIIVPSERLYTDGERDQFRCLVNEKSVIDGPTSFTFKFICHGKEVKLSFQDMIPTMNVTMDIDYDGTKCVCAAYSKENVRIQSEMTLNISMYHPVLKLQAQYIIQYGGSVTLTCMSSDLIYPFEYGNWLYTRHRQDDQWTKTTLTPLDLAVSANNTQNSSSLIIHNTTYEQMGSYQCTVVDVRKNNLVIGNSTTRLFVNGPIIMDGMYAEQRSDICMIFAAFRSFPKISVISWWENYKRMENVAMKKTNMIEDDPIRQNYSSGPFSCSGNDTYGLTASNDVTTFKRYFSSTGVILKSFPIIQVHGKLIDGYQVSVICYDIDLTNGSYLSLTCDNTSATRDSNSISVHTPVLQMSYVADVDDGKVCSCTNKITGDAEEVDLRIDHYKSTNVSNTLEKCESSSQIYLKCSYSGLPRSFIFDGWIHRFNGVNIRKLDGTSTGQETTLHIPFCTYEDMGNYTCLVIDSRKNRTILNSTIYLDVPGPPIITNTSVEKLGDRKGCRLNVSFYSFDNVVKTTWYKNGKRLISSENMKQGLIKRKHLMAMHGIPAPLDAYVANLHVKPMCDVEDNVYNFTVHTSVYKATHIFQADDNPMRKVLILILIVITGILVAGLNVTICRAFRDSKKTKTSFRDSLYTRAKGIRDSMFYEEIHMVIQNMRHRHQEIDGPGRLTICESTYAQIPADYEEATSSV